MKILLSSVAFVVLFSSKALAVQHFTCWNLPASASDSQRVVISLVSANEGTLFLSSGLDDFGNQDSTGPLKLEKVATNANTLISTWSAKNTTSSFTVTIPDAVVGRNLNDVTLGLEMANDRDHASFEIGCYTRIYE